jgi:hypothetical protein
LSWGAVFSAKQTRIWGKALLVTEKRMKLRAVTVGGAETGADALAGPKGEFP